MAKKQQAETWPATGATEVERQTLMAVYARLEQTARPLVEEYLRAQQRVTELRAVLRAATETGTGLLMANGHTYEQARGIIAAWKEPIKGGAK